MLSSLWQRIVRVLVFTALFAGAITFAADASSEPETEYRALLAMRREQAPTEYARGSDEFFNWAQVRYIEMNERGLEFLQKYPRHPRRWDVLLLLESGRDYELQITPAGTKVLLPQKEGQEKWQRRYYGLLEDLVAAADAGAPAKQEALRQLISYWARRLAREKADEPDRMALKVQRWFDQFRRDFPTSGALGPLYQAVAEMLDALDPKKCLAFLREAMARHASNAPADRIVRETIAGRVRALEGQAQPVEPLWARLAEFDPAFRDHSAYNGKVVLIVMVPVSYEDTAAFVQHLYGRFHDAGLEIIHVAEYNRPDSPPEQRDKTAMERYVAERKWPWRMVWNQRRSGILGLAGEWGLNSVPAYLVIGRDGRLADRRQASLPEVIARELAVPAP